MVVTIETGNDGMQTPEDVARALEDVARALRVGKRAGKVIDVNGNTVGRYTMDDKR